ncbi:proton-coupled folate transporter-like [Acanthaster planci]|uniref:Proton-coupled folate transporter n=1 Tax=Acanthaster planci TaxID=133434 RepID=A0A8B7ZQ72_ACAPL|nr:proton-coupled folate transporter-like [Acanthaster planci]
MAIQSEDKPLLEPEALYNRSPWISFATFIILQFLIFIPEGVMQTLSAQFTRSAFARERNFTLPVGVNSCTTSNVTQELNDIQAATALFATYQSVLKDFVPVLTTLPLTAASDFTGRRPIILLRCFGGLAMTTGFLIVSFWDLSVYYSLFGCAVFGFSGGYVLLNSICMLYVTDIFAAETRGTALAIVYGIEISVMYIGTLVVNILLQALSSYTVPFLIATVSALLACLWVLPSCLVQESIKKRPLDLGVITNITEGIRCLFTKATNSRRRRLLALLVCDMLVNFQVEGFESTMDLYGLGEPFCWSPTFVGVFWLMHGIPQAFGTPLTVWLIGLVGLSSYWVIYISLVSGIGLFLLTAVAKSNAVLIYGASLVGISAGASRPMFVLLMTKTVDTKNQGALFAMSSLLSAVSVALSIIIQKVAYSFAVTEGHVVVLFLVMALMCGLILVPVIFLHVLELKSDIDDPDPISMNSIDN